MPNGDHHCYHWLHFQLACTWSLCMSQQREPCLYRWRWLGVADRHRAARLLECNLCIALVPGTDSSLVMVKACWRCRSMHAFTNHAYGRQPPSVQLGGQRAAHRASCTANPNSLTLKRLEDCSRLPIACGKNSAYPLPRKQRLQ